MELTDFDRNLLREVSGDIPLVTKPFAAIAQKLGVEEADVVTRLRELREAGVLRRFGARVNHYAVGKGENTMIVWQVADHEAEALGEKLSRHHAVSHCYLRPPLPELPFTLYTMVHAASKDEMARIVGELKDMAGAPSILLPSTREYKKSAPRYFPA